MNLYLQAAALGVIAGMRSMSAPALTSDHFRQHPSPALELSLLKGMASPKTARVLKWMALGELGVDKLPGVPNRTAPGPLGARAVSGGVCGAALFLAQGERPERGALTGAAAALASAFLFFYLRRSLGQGGRIPDYALAAVEDGLALSIGKRAFS